MGDDRKHYRVFVRSFGCSSSVADGEFISGCLAEAGFEMVETVPEADVLIYNTCAVKTPTENRVLEVLKKASHMKGKRLVVTGCLPMINFERLESEVAFDAALGPNCGNRIVDTLSRIAKNESIVGSSIDRCSRRNPSLDLPRRAVNPIISIVPIAQGCLGSCSYCCVVSARGRLWSCSIEDVVRRIKRDLDAGAREVWLTGQDTASYGKDIGVNLVDLLNKVCEIQGKFQIRVGMMTPNLVLDILPELVEAFQNDHVFKFVHLPVQSGNCQVLKRMNRSYSVDDFRYIIRIFRKAIPRITVATDVIVGFPGESREAFEQTLRLMEEVKPDVINISKFFPRPKTAAEKMTSKILPIEVKERSRKMTNLARKISLEKNRGWRGWKGLVLIDEIGKHSHSLIGRNFAYKPIVIKKSHSMLGSSMNVHVTKAFQTYLEAENPSSPNS